MKNYMQVCTVLLLTSGFGVAIFQHSCGMKLRKLLQLKGCCTVLAIAGLQLISLWILTVDLLVDDL